MHGQFPYIVWPRSERHSCIICSITSNNLRLLTQSWSSKMETNPSSSNVLGLPGQSIERTLIVAEDDIPFETLTDFVIQTTRREEQDDGFYIMNMERTISAYNKWCALLPRIRPFYAIKCNPDPVLVRQLKLLGTGFDCASKGEIEFALSIGCKPNDIIYANPCKKPSHLRFAAKHGISMMTFDSKEELMKIKDICPSSAEILIRFTPRIDGALYNLSFKFGAAIEDCADILTTAKNLGLNVVGVSFHVGSDCFNEMCFKDCIYISRHIFDQAKKIGFLFSILDIGGGYPGDGTSEELLLKMFDVINHSLDEHFPASSGIKIIAEPGKYFASSPFTLITNVIAAKEVDKKRFKEKNNSPVKFTDTGPDKGFVYFIDDGVYGSFSELLLSPEVHFQPIPLKKISDEVYPTCIWGQSCDGTDFVNKACNLPKLSVGDWLYFKDFGAYTNSVASNFNGFGASKYTYYYITMETWKKMKWTSEDFKVNVVFIDAEKALITT